MLDCLQSFCDCYGMQVNVAKCAVVVFGAGAPRDRDVPAQGWTYAGQQLPVCTEFKYLGVVLHQSRGMFACVPALRTAGLRAMWGMLAKCRERGIRSLELQARLFDSLVAPVLGYCSEEWAPSLLHRAATPEACMARDLHAVQTCFLRQLAGGVRKSTARQLLLREFGCRPLCWEWVRSCVVLWNRAVEAPPFSLLTTAMLENAQLSGSWFDGLFSMLRTFGALPPGGPAYGGVPAKLDVRLVMQQLDAWFYACWRDLPADPRVAPSEHVRCCRYQQWFAVGGGAQAAPPDGVEWGRWQQCPAYVRCTGGMPRLHARALSAFRLGAHWLEVEAGKWTRRPLPRSRRQCRLCRAGVGDEMHMVFECPGLSGVRQRHAALFDVPDACPTLSGVTATSAQLRRWAHQNHHRVAEFVHDCFAHRERVLSS
jgi:hypothetical protein